MTSRPTVALLGTGIMGLPMAANLLAAGLTVRVWNRTVEKARPLAEQGAEVFATPAEAVAGAEIVVTMLAEGQAVQDTFDAASLPPGVLWIQMSTVGVDWTDKLAAAAEKAGVAFVDAPVLGTKQPAEQGKLVVLAAGSEELRERCAPVFDAVGGRTLWVGPVGTATRLKLVANAWVLALTNATAESVGLAQALGVDPNLFLEAIKGGSLDVPYAHLKGAAMVAGEFPPAFPARLAAKDARLVLEAAGDTVDLSGTAATLGHLEAAVEAGYGDEDMAALYRAVVPGSR
ncbi:NAD(P)-dependent oxidoreductase [Amycolatopsis sp.]|uniref:NAD(P)-dependent oxidoreductase n=1 Tax=Amycolatopsis sp. TaxID=37632 RepID=UPI002E079553|nr:NAD(P)-dependent oxidoreductase [Amycolatopsis sp.]